MKARTLELRLGGERVRARLEGLESLRERMASLFPSRFVERAGPCDLEVTWRNGAGLVRRGGRTVGRGRSAAVVCLLAEWAATAEVLERLRRRAVLLHAAWVASPHGGALLVGAHGSGKTTLSAALALRHRWGLRCDDLVLLGRGGLPKAFERPVRFKPGCARALPELRRMSLDCSPWRSGWPVLVPLARFRRAGRGGLRGIVLLDGRRSGPARLSRQGEGAAVADLARHISNFRERPAQTLAALAKVVRRVPVWRLRGGSLADRCRVLAMLPSF